MISADKIIFYILCIISLIFGIFGLMAYTKLSNEKFQSTNYCVPCVNSTGDNYNNTDGTTVPCETIPNYLLSPGGQTALINALQIIDNNNTFNFKVNTANTAGSASSIDGTYFDTAIENWLKSTNGGGKMGMTFTTETDPNDKNKEITKLNASYASTAGSAEKLSDGQCGIFVNKNQGMHFMFAQCGLDDCNKGGTSMVLGSTDKDGGNLPCGDERNENNWYNGLPFMNNGTLNCNYCY